METLYRVMYETFTPKMMQRTPLWLERRIAAALGWRMVETLSADAWLSKLFMKVPSADPSPIARGMFESCAGGNSMRPFFSLRWLWRQARRIWAGDTRQKETHVVHGIKAPGMLPDEADCMDTRRRIL